MYLSEYVTNKTKTKDMYGQRGCATTRKTKECVGSVFLSDRDPNTNKCNERTFTVLNRHQVRLLESHLLVTPLDGKE